MTPAASEFKLRNAGFKDTLVLVPGWAADHRVFSALRPGYNLILPERLCFLSFHDALLGFLKANSIKKVSLFGWSLGGFLAAEFALKFPEKTGRLILVSIRKKYPDAELREIREKVSKNRAAFLYKFYLSCFSEKDKDGLAWFKKNLLKPYLREMGKDYLLRGLDYLSGASIDKKLENLPGVQIFHGARDRIAPVKEVEELMPQLKNAEFTLIESGHLPFLCRDFPGISCDG